MKAKEKFRNGFLSEFGLEDSPTETLPAINSASAQGEGVVGDGEDSVSCLEKCEIDELSIPRRNRFQEAMFVMKMVQNDGVPCIVNEYLSIGSVGAAYNLPSLLSHGITHIICLSALCRIKFPDQFTYLKVPIQDNSSADISLILEDCFRFILLAKERHGRILIHCFQGVSRSAAILCAVLMKFHNLTLDESLTALRQIRPVVAPNSAFLASLRKFERQLAVATPPSPAGPSYGHG